MSSKRISILLTAASFALVLVLNARHCHAESVDSDIDNTIEIDIDLDKDLAEDGDTDAFFDPLGPGTGHELGNQRSLSQNESQATRAGQNVIKPSTNPEDIHFWLYYDKNNLELKDEVVLNDTASVNAAHFVKGQPVIFVTHGFRSSYDDGGFVAHVKNSYLNAGFVNIIATDWRTLAASGAPDSFTIFSYIDVVQNGVPITGKRICKMIIFLMKAKIITGPEQVHLVGHSLGSHVSGIAGYCVKQRVAKLVDRISGIDPAGPLYWFMKPESRLDAGDAAFVDVTHTDNGRLGSDMKLGTVDFYANGGKGVKQPGCINATLDPASVFQNVILGSCAHARAYLYFARSILRTPPELYGCRCVVTETLVIPHFCVSPIKTCADKTLYGQYVPRTANGTFYVKVQRNLPGLGVQTPSVPLSDV